MSHITSPVTTAKVQLQAHLSGTPHPNIRHVSETQAHIELNGLCHIFRTSGVNITGYCGHVEANKHSRHHHKKAATPIQNMLQWEAMMNITTGDKLSPQISGWVGTRTSVLGISGGGKSNTVAVLIEELAPHIPMSIVDPEGEMWSLRQQLDLLIVGKSENVDIEIQPHQAEVIARFSVEHRVSVILDLFDYTDDEAEQTVLNYVTGIWEAVKHNKRPYHLVVEEADEFMPQPLPKGSIWKRIASRGRKYGLGMIIASQRSAKIDKNVLTQCDHAILHRVSHPRDMAVYKDIIPQNPKVVEQKVQNLETGDAILVLRGNVHTEHIRQRTTHHAGATPTLDPQPTADAPVLREPKPEDLAVVRKLLLAQAPPKPSPEIVSRDNRIKSLESEKEIADSLIADLQAEIDRLKKHSQSLQSAVDVLRLIKVEIVHVGAGLDPSAGVDQRVINGNNTSRPTRMPPFQPKLLDG